MGYKILNVKLFGGFSIEAEGNPEVLYSVRNTKVAYLLQYMLANPGRGFTKEALVTLLYTDDANDKVENPSNALKIIIHRMKRLLAEYGLPQDRCLIYKDGKYCWNPDYPCKIDTQIFEDSIKNAMKKECPEEERILLLKRAISLYVGEFLPHLAAEEWVIPLSVRYQQMYMDCIYQLFEILDRSGSYKQMLNICKQASILYPYEESLRYIRIYCLYRLNFLEEAIKDYHATVEMLSNEFGVIPSRELVDLYKEMAEKLKNEADSVKDIRANMSEELKEGAYYCNLQNFSDTYRFMVRGIERSGQLLHLMLVSLVNEKGRPPLRGEALRLAADNLYITMKNSLRKGDLYTQYSPTQFLALLVGINRENCALVFDRIEKQYRRLDKSSGIGISYEVVSATNLDIPHL